jgi:hypothetical protein
MSLTLVKPFLTASWKEERHGYCIQDGITAYKQPRLSDLHLGDGRWDVDG